MARLDTADQKLASLSSALAAEQQRTGTLTAGLDTVKADLAAARRSSPTPAATFKVWQATATGPVAAGSGLFVNLMAVQP